MAVENLTNLINGGSNESAGLGSASTGGSSNSPAEGKGNQINILGNVIIGNGQIITDQDNTPDQLTSQVSNFITSNVDSLLDKLETRLLSSSTTGNPDDNGNPFADGRNPFGEGNFPSLPALDEANSVYGDNFPVGVTDSGNPFAGGDNPVVGSDNPVVGSDNPVIGSDNPVTGSDNPVTGSDNPFAGGSNPFAGSDNPFAGSDNPFAGSGIPQEPSFDISSILFGNSVPFLNNAGTDGDGSTPTVSSTEILKSVKASISNFTSSLDNIFADGNTTPLQTPSDLLNLFRADIYSFNNGINNINALAANDPSASGSIDFSAGGSNPFASLFPGDSNPFGDLAASGKIPFDLLNVALNGLLPFNGSDNVFTTNNGDLPIGYGNNDFGSKNAAIGNANWNYGNNNASIGNGNWNWDFSHDNATIGNGNWNLDSSHDNRTVGNGNWYWNSTSKNATLGNGNWDFGNDNTTLGNGNLDFGSNNTVIGNGNWVFTSNSIIIGNGNWSVTLDKSTSTASDFLSQLDTWSLSMGVKDATKNLVNSLLGKLGEAFVPLTGDLQDSGLQTYNRLILSQSSQI